MVRWQQANRDSYNSSQRRYRAENRDRLREGHLKRSYGIDLDAYSEMLQRQGGACAICGAAPPPGGSLHVDHDHETGAVRGLLCIRCHNALGLFQESLALLGRAGEYLTPDVSHAKRGALVGLARRRALAIGRRG